MSNTDDLFLLVKSLSRNEKRYFKVFASKQKGGEKKNYMRLFEAVDKHEAYNEEKLKDKFKGESFVKYLSSEKKYLVQMILKCMRNFHTGDTVEMQMKELLQDEAFLRSKNLNYLRKKTLEKAQKLALKYEKWPVLLQVLDRKSAAVVERNTKNLMSENEQVLTAYM